MKKGSHHSKAARKKIALWGRPEIEIDLAEVERLQASGLGLRAVAKKLSISVFKLQCARGVIDYRKYRKGDKKQ